MGQAFITRRGGGGYAEGDVISSEKVQAVYGSYQKDVHIERAVIAVTANSLTPYINPKGDVFTYGEYGVASTSSSTEYTKKGYCIARDRMGVSSLVTTSDSDVVAICASDDGETCAVYTKSGNLKVYSVLSGTLLWSKSIGAITDNMDVNLVCLGNVFYGNAGYLLFCVNADGTNYFTRNYENDNDGWFFSNCIRFDKNNNLVGSTRSSKLVKIKQDDLTFVWTQTISDVAPECVNAWENIGVSGYSSFCVYSSNGVKIKSFNFSSSENAYLKVSILPNESENTDNSVSHYFGLNRNKKKRPFKTMNGSFNTITNNFSYMPEDAWSITSAQNEQASYNDVAGIPSGPIIGRDGKLWIKLEDVVICITPPITGYTVLE
nr:MAG TPA: hypothetical protein [Caudoviricetes sp.]